MLAAADAAAAAAPPTAAPIFNARAHARARTHTVPASPPLPPPLQLAPPPPLAAAPHGVTMEKDGEGWRVTVEWPNRKVGNTVVSGKVELDGGGVLLVGGELLFEFKEAHDGMTVRQRHALTLYVLRVAGENVDAVPAPVLLKGDTPAERLCSAAKALGPLAAEQPWGPWRRISEMGAELAFAKILSHEGKNLVGEFGGLSGATTPEVWDFMLASLQYVVK